MTSELGADRVTMDRHARYLGQRSFRSRVIVHTHTHTHTRRSTALANNNNMRDHRSWLTTPLLVQQEPKSGKRTSASDQSESLFGNFRHAGTHPLRHTYVVHSDARHTRDGHTPRHTCYVCTLGVAGGK